MGGVGRGDVRAVSASGTRFSSLLEAHAMKASDLIKRRIETALIGVAGSSGSVLRGPFGDSVYSKICERKSPSQVAGDVVLGVLKNLHECEETAKTGLEARVRGRVETDFSEKFGREFARIFFDGFDFGTVSSLVVEEMLQNGSSKNAWKNVFATEANVRVASLVSDEELRALVSESLSNSVQAEEYIRELKASFLQAQKTLAETLAVELRTIVSETVHPLVFEALQKRSQTTVDSGVVDASDESSRNGQIAKKKASEVIAALNLDAFASEVVKQALADLRGELEAQRQVEVQRRLDEARAAAEKAKRAGEARAAAEARVAADARRAEDARAAEARAAAESAAEVRRTPPAAKTAPVSSARVGLPARGESFSALPDVWHGERQAVQGGVFADTSARAEEALAIGKNLSEAVQRITREEFYSGDGVVKQIREAEKEEKYKRITRAQLETTVFRSLGLVIGRIVDRTVSAPEFASEVSSKKAVIERQIPRYADAFVDALKGIFGVELLVEDRPGSGTVTANYTHYAQSPDLNSAWAKASRAFASKVREKIAGV